jgi:hypothetical protein
MRKLAALENTRIYTNHCLCFYCGDQEAILRTHYVRDELEAHCEWCERWLGTRITRVDVER